MATKEREKKLLVGFLGSYAAELKLLLTTLFLLCTVATLLQFIPSLVPISASDLRLCISRFSQEGIPPSSLSSVSQLSSLISEPPSPLPPPPPPPPPSSTVEQEQVQDDGTIKCVFNPYGSAAYSFITMGAYRGDLNTFAIIGLSSKPLHVYGKPTHECEWERRLKDEVVSEEKRITTVGYKILPDWGYGHVYTVVVVSCTFSEPVNVDNYGGKLVLYASDSGGGSLKFNVTDRMEVLTESPGTLDTNLFVKMPKYNYFYCGPLYSNLNPQRLREWIAYHVRLFGPRSHFVIHDAGGFMSKYWRW